MHAPVTGGCDDLQNSRESESESEIYWNEPVYPGHYYSFTHIHMMRAFAHPGMPGLAYASYWPLGQFYYNLIWLNGIV